MASKIPIEALLQFRKGSATRVGPDRIRLLRAIQAHGSITEAATKIGLSYKGAWDAVQAMNNLFARPLVTAQSGGTRGGGAALTLAGEAVLAAYGKVESVLARVAEQIEEAVSGEHAFNSLVWSIGMKTSARNALRGTVEKVTDGAVNAEVVLRVAPSVTIVSIVTRESVSELGLAPGRQAVALIKSSFVILALAGDGLRTSARNCFIGTIIHHEEGAVNDEVVLEIDDGKTITATITRRSADDLGIKVGVRAQALVKASHVILAVD